MYDIPGTQVTMVRVDEDVVRGKKGPVYERDGEVIEDLQALEGAAVAQETPKEADETPEVTAEKA